MMAQHAVLFAPRVEARSPCRLRAAAIARSNPPALTITSMIILVSLVFLVAFTGIAVIAAEAVP
jgi:hypothetical protein